MFTATCGLFWCLVAQVVPGELTIVSGLPNSGKSEWLDALAVNLAKQHGWRFGLCSLENTPVDHARKLMEKYTGAQHSLRTNVLQLPSDAAWTGIALDSSYGARLAYMAVLVERQDLGLLIWRRRDRHSPIAGCNGIGCSPALC